MLRSVMSILLLALLLFSGCEANSLLVDGPQCRANSDCNEDLGCEQGFCVVLGANDVGLSARIIPPPGSGLLQQQVPSLSLSSGPDVLVTLLQPVTLSGVVQIPGKPDIVNVPGELEARTTGDLPGLDYRFTAPSIEGVDENFYGYSLKLLPGRAYEVTFRADKTFNPEGKSLPPFCFYLSPEEAVDGEFDIQLPALTDYVEIQGVVRFDSYEPIPGARISATLPDGQGVASVKTEGMKGFFSLTLPPDTTEMRLQVEAPDEGPVFPALITDWMEPGSDLAITIPSLPNGMEELDVSISVQGEGADGEISGAAGLPVVLVGHLEGGSLRRTATTNEIGIANLKALPGAYEVLVSVPPGSPFGSFLGKLNLMAEPGVDEDHAPPTAHETIQLERRPRFLGLVLDHNSFGVYSGTVIARRQVKWEADHSLVIAPAPFQAPIEADGTFALHVDRGTYDLQILPAPETGAPPTLVREQQITQDHGLPLSLPPPGLASVTVVAPGGEILPDVTVELYLQTASPQTESLSTPRWLTKGTTDPNGVVQLLVPHEQ